MLISDLTIFNELAEKVGNRYATSMYVSKAARQLAKKLPKYIIESYLIHWVLTEEDPKNLKIYSREPGDRRYMNDLLCWIEDEDVNSAVREMYSKSVKSHHLVYNSSKKLNKHQQDRANILLRMIWYQFE